MFLEADQPKKERTDDEFEKNRKPLSKALTTTAVRVIIKKTMTMTVADDRPMDLCNFS